MEKTAKNSWRRSRKRISLQFSFYLNWGKKKQKFSRTIREGGQEKGRVGEGQEEGRGGEGQEEGRGEAGEGEGQEEKEEVEEKTMETKYKGKEEEEKKKK